MAIASLSPIPGDEVAVAFAFGIAAIKAAKAAKAADALGDMIRVRHYTNNKGLQGIAESGVIRASDQNRVFAEAAKHKPMSRVDAERAYGLKQGRGRNYVETDVPKNQVSQRYNPSTGANELVVEGELPLRNATFIKRQ